MTSPAAMENSTVGNSARSKKAVSRSKARKSSSWYTMAAGKNQIDSSGMLDPRRFLDSPVYRTLFMNGHFLWFDLTKGAVYPLTPTLSIP